jgi:hypothetical protein
MTAPRDRRCRHWIEVKWPAHRALLKRWQCGNYAMRGTELCRVHISYHDLAALAPSTGEGTPNSMVALTMAADETRGLSAHVKEGAGHEHPPGSSLNRRGFGTLGPAEPDPRPDAPGYHQHRDLGAANGTVWHDHPAHVKEGEDV